MALFQTPLASSFALSPFLKPRRLPFLNPSVSTHNNNKRPFLSLVINSQQKFSNGRYIREDYLIVSPIPFPWNLISLLFFDCLVLSFLPMSVLVWIRILFGAFFMEKWKRVFYFFWGTDFLLFLLSLSVLFHFWGQKVSAVFAIL